MNYQYNNETPQQSEFDNSMIIGHPLHQSLIELNVSRYDHSTQ